MVIRVAYREEHYATVDELDRGIQRLIDVGWRIAQATGPDDGPFAVLFRMDEAPNDAAVRRMPASAAPGTRR